MIRRLREPLLALAALAATLALLELGARLLLAPPRYHDHALQLDPELGFAGIPGHRVELENESGAFEFTLNADGLRGPELPDMPAAAGVSRVAFFGDSFLVGRRLPEEQLMTRRTGDRLRERGEPAEIYNLSAVDWGTAQQLLLLRAVGPRLAPDAVVLVLYPSNDLANNSPGLAGRTQVSPGDYIRPYLVPGEHGLGVRYTHPTLATLRRHSRLFAHLERRLLSIGEERGIAWLSPWPPRVPTPERLRSGRMPREDFEIFRRHDPGHRWERAWQDTFALLRAFRDECAGLGARLLVLVVPSVQQVEVNAKTIRSEIATRLVTGRSLESLVDWDLPERRLAAFFAEEGIEARLLLEPLRAEVAAGGGSVYLRDEHLGARAHELAAERVAAWLLGEPPPAPLPVAGGPVSLLPAADRAPGLLDFRRSPYAEHLGDGWADWRREQTHLLGGWWWGGNALAVLPRREGDLVVRGAVPPGDHLPIEGALTIVGGPRQRFRLGRAGPFEIRLVGPRPEQMPAVDGFVAIVLEPDGAAGRLAGAGVRVRELGFEPVDAG